MAGTWYLVGGEGKVDGKQPESDADYQVGNSSGGWSTLTDGNRKILASFLPDYLLGQVLYGGTVTGAGVATLSANAKTRLGTSSATITLTNDAAAVTGYQANEGVYYICENAVNNNLFSLDLNVGDWLISTGGAWKKIDNTDANIALAATTNSDTDTDTNAVASAAAGSVAQTVWNKIRSVVNAMAGKVNTTQTINGTPIGTGNITITAAPTAHNLVDTTGHPVSGLTTGTVLKATSATAYGFSTVDASGIASGAVTTAKLSDSTGASDGVTMAKIAQGIGVLGQRTATSGAPSYYPPTAASTVLRSTAANAYEWGKVALTTDVSGTLPVANGGIGVSTATQNYVFAGPGSGTSAAAPSFRALVAADIPQLSPSKITTATAGQVLLGRYTSSAGTAQEITLGSGLSLSTAGVLTASSSSSGIATAVDRGNTNMNNITTTGFYRVAGGNQSDNNYPASGTTAWNLAVFQGGANSIIQIARYYSNSHPNAYIRTAYSSTSTFSSGAAAGTITWGAWAELGAGGGGTGTYLPLTGGTLTGSGGSKGQLIINADSSLASDEPRLQVSGGTSNGINVIKFLRGTCGSAIVGHTVGGRSVLSIGSQSRNAATTDIYGGSSSSGEPLYYGSYITLSASYNYSSTSTSYMNDGSISMYAINSISMYAGGICTIRALSNAINPNDTGESWIHFGADDSANGERIFIDKRHITIASSTVSSASSMLTRDALYFTASALPNTITEPTTSAERGTSPYRIIKSGVALHTQSYESTGPWTSRISISGTNVGIATSLIVSPATLSTSSHYVNIGLTTNDNSGLISVVSNSSLNKAAALTAGALDLYLSRTSNVTRSAQGSWRFTVGDSGTSSYLAIQVNQATSGASTDNWVTRARLNYASGSAWVIT